MDQWESSYLVGIFHGIYIHQDGVFHVFFQSGGYFQMATFSKQDDDQLWDWIKLGSKSKTIHTTGGPCETSCYQYVLFILFLKKTEDNIHAYCLYEFLQSASRPSDSLRGPTVPVCRDHLDFHGIFQTSPTSRAHWNHFGVSMSHCDVCLKVTEIPWIQGGTIFLQMFPWNSSRKRDLELLTLWRHWQKAKIVPTDFPLWKKKCGKRLVTWRFLPLICCPLQQIDWFCFVRGIIPKWPYCFFLWFGTCFFRGNVIIPTSPCHVPGVQFLQSSAWAEELEHPEPYVWWVNHDVYRCLSST